MGSCISKCRSKRTKAEDQDCNYVQDKMVISQAQVSPIPPPITKKYSLPPPSPPSSTSSLSCTTSSSYSLTSSLSSSSSCSSSILSAKDRSFSNEFLWSCAKHNPQIMPTKVPIVAPMKQSIPQRPVRTTSQKRARASSPTLTRQKSFRKEPEKPTSTNSSSSRILRSPSPSRRFSTGENRKGFLSNTTKESYGKCLISSNVSRVSYEASCVMKENVRPSSPSNNVVSRHCSHLRNREKCSYNQIGLKVDEIAVEEVVSNADVDQSVPMEDIDNPLIALDCFIFL